MLDDFYVWQKGGKSLLGDMWQKLSDSLEDSDSTLNNVFGTIEKIFGLLSKVVDIVFDVGSGIGNWAVESGLAERGLNTVKTIINQILTLVNTIIDTVSIFLDGLGLLGDVITGKKDLNDLMEGIKQGGRDLGKTVSDGFWDFVLPFFGTTREEVFGTDAEKEAARSQRGAGIGDFNPADWKREVIRLSDIGSNATVTNNQTNNITVQQASGESASGTGSKVADSIASKRGFFTMVR